MTTTIQVTDFTKAELDRIKDAEEHTSYDSVVRSLVGNYQAAEA